MDKTEYQRRYREAKLLRQKADAIRKAKPIEATRLDEQARKIEAALDSAT